MELAVYLEHARSEEVRRGVTRPLHTIDVVRRDDRVGVQHRERHGAEAVGDWGDDLHRRPQAGRPGHRHRVEAELEALLRGPGIQDGHVQVDERGVRRRRHRRRVACGIVTDEHQRSALWAGAGEHAVAQRVAGSVEPGRLAVPHADDALVPGVGAARRQLRSHHRRCAEFLVHRRLVDDGQVGHEGTGVAPSSWSSPPRGEPG